MLASLVLISCQAYASNLSNEVVDNTQAYNQTISADQSHFLPHVVIDGQNNLFINGEQVTLSPLQQKAVTTYSTAIREYGPKVDSAVSAGVASTKSMFGELADGFQALIKRNHIDTTLDEYRQQVSQYIKDGEVVFPVDVFHNEQTYQKQIQTAVSSATDASAQQFAAMSEKMTANEITLQKMEAQVVALQAQLHSMSNDSHSTTDSAMIKSVQDNLKSSKAILNQEQKKVALAQAEINENTSNLNVNGNTLSNAGLGKAAFNSTVAEQEQKLRALIPELQNYKIVDQASGHDRISTDSNVQVIQ